MNDAGLVDYSEGTEGLVNEELNVGVSELLAAADNLLEIGLHDVHDDVKGIEVLALWGKDIAKADNVVVVEVLQQLDLSEDALGKNDLLKDLLVDAFDGDEAVVVALIPSTEHDTVAARADNLLDDISVIEGIKLILEVLSVTHFFSGHGLIGI